MIYLKDEIKSKKVLQYFDINFIEKLKYYNVYIIGTSINNVFFDIKNNDVDLFFINNFNLLKFKDYISNLSNYKLEIIGINNCKYKEYLS